MSQLKYWNGSAWVTALVGAQGTQGVQGVQGVQGPITTNGLLTAPFEKVVIDGSTQLSNSNAAALNAANGSFYMYNSNPSASYAINITNAPTTVGQSCTFALMVYNANPAYLPYDITINGYRAGNNSTTLPTQGQQTSNIFTRYQGSPWTYVDTVSYCIYNLVVICTGTNAWTLLLSQTKF
jgi:hypothetical protein